MLTKISVQNFRGFQTLEVRPKPVTALLGPNSSGKSTVLHAIRFGCSVLSWALSDPRTKPWKSDDGWIGVWNGPVRIDEPFLPTSRAEELFTGTATDQELRIHLTFEDSDIIQEFFVALTFGNNQALKLSVWVKSSTAIDLVAGRPGKSKYVPRMLLDALRAGEPRAVFVPAFYGVIRREQARTTGQIEQHLSEGEQAQIVRNLVSRLTSLKELSDGLRLSVGAEISRCTSGQELDVATHLEALFRDTNGELELASAGTGLIALVALDASLRWYFARHVKGRPLIILLDEPEAHLHPRLQGQTGVRIADLVTGFGAQVFLATHSIEMANRLGTRRDAVLLGIDRTSKPAAVELTDESALVDALSRFCDLTPFAGLQLLASRRILFHEGTSDHVILEGCAQVYFANNPGRYAAFRKWTWARLEGASNAPAKDVLKKAIAPLFPALQSGELVRIVRVLDRDLHRQPVSGPAATDPKAHVEELDVVWSRHSIESLFIEPARLAAWIRPCLGSGPDVPPEADLLGFVAEAITAADADADLRQEAVLQLAPLSLRGKSLAQAQTAQAFNDSLRDARKMVESAPEVWQRGHDRAHFVLTRVRERLPRSLQNRVYRDIERIIRAYPGPALNASVLIPDEIRSLLDHMSR